MDLNILHLYIELAAVACLFFIAWLNVQYKATGKYSTLMALGLTMAGGADLLHALAPYINPELMQYWLPVSWGAGRLTLIITFLMVFLCYDIIKCQLKNLALILSVPLLFSLFALGITHTGAGDLSWTYASVDLMGVHIHRPIDFVLLILWSITMIILRPKSQILFPPNVYWIFMSQGIIIHTIMAFTSCESLDTAVFIAHGLKISEYYSFILIYLLYKTRLDNMPKKSCLDNPKEINNNCDVDKKSTGEIPHLGTR
jgi:accessory gene regulator protein AgrB